MASGVLARDLAIEKGLRKYSPCNCALTRKFVFGKELRLGRGRAVLSRSHQSTNGPQTEPRRSPLSPVRMRTPDFQALSPSISKEPQSAQRSLTPEPWADAYVSSPSPPRGARTLHSERVKQHQLQASLKSALFNSTQGPKSLSPSLASRKPVLVEGNQSFETILSFCDSVKESSRPLLTRISGTEKLMRRYGDVRNFINYLPQASGRPLRISRVTEYLNRHKLVRKSEFIDKESAQVCAGEKNATTVFISKRFGKPKVWKHTGRIIPLQAEYGLLGYWNPP